MKPLMIATPAKKLKKVEFFLHVLVEELLKSFSLSGGDTVCERRCADIDSSNVRRCKGTDPSEADESCEDSDDPANADA